MKSAPDEAKLFDSFLSLYEATDYTVALAGPALLDHYLEIKSHEASPARHRKKQSPYLISIKTAR